VKGWGHLRFIYGGAKEIVDLDRGAYPEKFGRWKGFLNRITVGSFGIKLSHIRLTGAAELRSECYSGVVLFGRSY
jgi:hypothetical protein